MVYEIISHIQSESLVQNANALSRKSKGNRKRLAHFDMEQIPLSNLCHIINNVLVVV